MVRLILGNDTVQSGLAFFLPSSILIHLSLIDIVIIVSYFAMVVWIGLYLKSQSNTSLDFFMAGRQMSAWIAGLSFLSANLGSLELMGWAGSAYQYGILAAHWYWIGAIPAMLFMGLVMMPFYYICKTHSVPGYLNLRFGESSRVLAGFCFAFMTILMSGVNMFAMALVMKVVLGWNISFSILMSSVVVALYVGLGGLRSAIFNEVLQFALIWCGALLVPVLGLIEAGGWHNLQAKILMNYHTSEYTHLWKGLGHFNTNGMGVQWTGIVFGLGFVISFGYWTTDFLVVQRAMAAKNLRAAQMAPIIAAAFKMAIPFFVILPGLLGLVVLHNNDGTLMHLVGQDAVSNANPNSYNEVLPLMMERYLGPGLLGLGITALIAGFMSGMAGNVSAFSTVWTYDIYKPLINKDGNDSHYVSVGRWATVLGIAVSIGTAYLVMQAAGIMDYVQALFSFFIAPLLGTVLAGMFWKRATKAGGFWGLLVGTVTSVALYAWVRMDPSAIRYVAFSSEAKAMAADLYRALWAFSSCALVTIVVSYCTKPKPLSELAGLVYGASKLPQQEPVPLFKNHWFWAAIVITVFFILNIAFY